MQEKDVSSPKSTKYVLGLRGTPASKAPAINIS